MWTYIYELGHLNGPNTWKLLSPGMNGPHEQAEAMLKIALKNDLQEQLL